MKRLLLVAFVAALAVALIGSSASAQLAVGTNKAKFQDFGSFFGDETAGSVSPLPVIYKDPTTHLVVNEPVAGQTFDRTILKVTQLFSPDSNLNSYYNGTNPEILGMFYDLKVDTVTELKYTTGPKTGQVYAISVTLVNGPRFEDSGFNGGVPYDGGRVDFWVNPANNFDPLGGGTGPNMWGVVADPTSGNPFDAGNYDTFPTLTGTIPFLSGTLVSPDGTSSVLGLTLWVDTDPFLPFVAGEGLSTTGFIHILQNPTGYPFISPYLGGTAEIQFNNRFSFGPLAPSLEPLYDNPLTTPIYWDTASDDPAYFAGIPEPTTIALLGTGLVGLLGYARRRSR